MIDSLVQSKQVDYTENNSYAYESSYPAESVLDSVDDVRERVFDAEQRVVSGDYISEEDFWKSIDERMKRHAN